MGGDSRYDRYRRPAGDREIEEASALHMIAELVTRTHPPINRTTVGQIAHVLNAAAIELNAGRALPIGVRRAVLGLADALRIQMDPRTGTTDADRSSAP